MISDNTNGILHCKNRILRKENNPCFKKKKKISVLQKRSLNHLSAIHVKWPLRTHTRTFTSRTLFCMQSEEDVPPRPPLPQLYSPEEHPPAVPPLPRETTVIRHTSVRGLKRQSDERKRDREIGQYTNGDSKVNLADIHFWWFCYLLCPDKKGFLMWNVCVFSPGGTQAFLKWSGAHGSWWWLQPHKCCTT